MNSVYCVREVITLKNNKLAPCIAESVFAMYKNVKLLREQHGLSQKQFAEIIKISKAKLILSESGTETGCFYDVHIKNICDYFNIRPDGLFTPKTAKS